MVPTFVDPSCKGLRPASRSRLEIVLPDDRQPSARALLSRVFPYVFHDVLVLHSVGTKTFALVMPLYHLPQPPTGSTKSPRAFGQSKAARAGQDIWRAYWSIFVFHSSGHQ
eukprot:815010-Pyramimonas_sp.AAC.1